MDSIKRVLCPLDFSSHSEKAFELAVEMARTFHAELVLGHVVAPVPMGVGSVGMATYAGAGFNVESYQKQLVQQAEDTLKDWCEKRVPSDMKTRFVVTRAYEAEGILRMADDEKADLIVISTHGRTGLTRLIIGSTAEKILRHADQPVLSVRVTETEDS